MAASRHGAFVTMRELIGQQRRREAAEAAFRRDRLQQNARETIQKFQDLGMLNWTKVRPEYIHNKDRLDSFSLVAEDWKRDNHPLRDVSTAADAGFYYAGYGDAVRCWFCNGGIRDWKEGWNAWVEHARCFPACHFVRTKLSNDFLASVSHMSIYHEDLSLDRVIENMNSFPNKEEEDKTKKQRTMFREPSYERNVAVESLVESGYKYDDLIPLAKHVEADGEVLSVEILFEKINEHKLACQSHLSVLLDKVNNFTPTLSHDNNSNIDDKIESNKLLIAELVDCNYELRLDRLCKVCYHKEADVFFYPCGHSACSACAMPLKTCHTCRTPIRLGSEVYCV